MVIVLKGSERPRNRDLFDRAFKLRHDVFVKARGWSLPSIGGREVDQFDTDQAKYFLDVSDDGVIEAHIRVTPTMSSSLIAEYFPHLVERGSPRGPDIWECTRYIVQPRRKSREGNRAAKARVISAMLEWALESQLTYLQTVIDTPTLSSYLEMTLQTIPLGLSHPYGGGRDAPGGGECMAIRWPVTLDVLEDVRRYGGISAPTWTPDSERTREPAYAQ